MSYGALRWAGAWLVLGLGASACPASASGEQAPSSSAAERSALTLGDAINRATHHNYAVRQARARIDAHAGEVRHAERPTPSNPRVSLNTARRAADAGDSTQDVGLRLSQKFWTADKGSIQLEAARARQSAAKAQLDFLVTSVRARTRRAFLRLLAAEKALATAERVLKTARALQSFTRRRLKAGEATELEVNTADIGVGRAQAALAQAKRQRTQAKLALAERLARDPAKPLEVRGQLQPAPLELPERTKLLNAAAQRRGDLTAAAQKLAANREALKLSKAKLWPNIKVFTAIEREGHNEVARIGASMPVALLHRFEGEQKEAKAKVRQAQLAQDALRLKVRRQVLEALSRYRSARQRVETFTERMLASAEQNLWLTRQAFQAGKVGAPAITSAQNNLLTVRRSYLNALNDLVRAGTDLERASGGLLAIQPLTDAAAQSPNQGEK